MQAGMFVVLGSDIEETDLTAVSRKLKRLHRRKENRLTERRQAKKTLMSSASPSPAPSSPNSEDYQDASTSIPSESSSSSSTYSSINSYSSSICARVGDETSVENLFDEVRDFSRELKRKRKTVDSINDKLTVKKNRSGFKTLEVEKESPSTSHNNQSCVISQVSEGFKSSVIGEEDNQIYSHFVVNKQKVSKKGKANVPVTNGLWHSRNRDHDTRVQCITSCKSCPIHTPIELSPEEAEEMRDYVALDCEFVGVGPKGSKSALGRCSIVSADGQVLFDQFVTPEEVVTDYRTPWSGLRPRHIQHGIPVLAAQEQIARLLQGKIVVGHAVYNDFKVLGFPHPGEMIRDTASCKLLREMAGFFQVTALRKLSQALLGRSIQKGGHCSVTDARASMDLFRLVRAQWEPTLQAKFSRREARNRPQPGPGAACTSPGFNSFLDDCYWPAGMF